jgi:hypothetical protein
VQVSGQHHVSVALLLEKLPPIPNALEAGWAPGPVSTLWRTANTLSLPGTRTPTAESHSRYPVVLPTDLCQLRAVVAQCRMCLYLLLFYNGGGEYVESLAEGNVLQS